MNTSDRLEADEPLAGGRLPPLYNIVYCSRAVAGIDEAAVDAIVQVAQRHNARHGITGLLVFGSGMFFQWLEGPRTSVRQLMANIQADPRHDSVVVLSETEEVRERLFPDWAMERVTPDHIREVLQDAQDSAGDARSAEALGGMLAQLESGPLSVP